MFKQKEVANITVIKNKKTKKKTQLNGMQRLKESGMIVSLLTALFAMVSLLTFDPADPSWSQTARNAVVHNNGGSLGSWFADTLFFTFGSLAYIIPLVLFAFGWALFRRRKQHEPIDLLIYGTRLLGIAIIILASCGLADTNFDDIWYFSSGGIIGDVLTDFLMPMLNALGLTLLFLFSWGIGFTLLTGISWLTVVETLGMVTVSICLSFMNVFRRDGRKHTLTANQYTSGQEPQLAHGAGIEPRFDMQNAQVGSGQSFGNDSMDPLFSRPTAESRAQASAAAMAQSISGNPSVNAQPVSQSAVNTVATDVQGHNINDSAVEIDDPQPRFNIHMPNRQAVPEANLSQEFGVAQEEPTNSHEQINPVPQNPIHQQPESQVPVEGHAPVTQSKPKILGGQSIPQQVPPQSQSEALDSVSAQDRMSTQSNTSEQNNREAESNHLNRTIEELDDIAIQTGDFADQNLNEQTTENASVHHVPVDNLETNVTENRATRMSTSQYINAAQDAMDQQVNQQSHAPNNVETAQSITLLNEDEQLEQPSLHASPAQTPQVVATPTPPPLTSAQMLQQENALDTQTQQAQTITPQNSDQDAAAFQGMVAQAQANAMASQNPFLIQNDQNLPVPTSPMPTLDLLYNPGKRENTIDRDALENIARLVESKLADYKIEAKVVDIFPGPVITRFELDLAPGVKVSRISGLSMDLARSLSAMAVRVVEVIPGKPYVGLELPNMNRETVYFSDVINSATFQQNKSPTAIVLGQDIAGEAVVADLSKMPHVLVAGTTGSGKSVGVNVMILSILYKATPDEVRFIMIDPKMLELSIYEGIPHLLSEVVTDMKDASNALRWCVGEMERRYKLMSALGVRNLKGFNDKLKMAAEAGHPIHDPLWQPGDSMDQMPPMLEKLPYIVVIVDEFADLIMVVGKKVEELIARLAQKARAAGIHLVLATQRPSVDVITGLIKANIPARVAFTVSTKTDSRTILDQGGAESLLGMGDMLYLPSGSNHPVRVHGAFATDDDVHNVVNDWKARGKPKYIEEIISGDQSADSLLPGEQSESEEELDPLYDQVVEFVTESRKGSISGVQRRFKIGYNRAARIVDQLELQGVVSAQGHNGNREVIAPPPIKHFDN